MLCTEDAVPFRDRRASVEDFQLLRPSAALPTWTSERLKRDLPMEPTASDWIQSSKRVCQEPLCAPCNASRSEIGVSVNMQKSFMSSRRQNLQQKDVARKLAKPKSSAWPPFFGSFTTASCT